MFRTQRCSPFSLQAYFRQGVALQYLGRHADALAAFASGLAQDPKSLQLLVGMVEAAMKSPLGGTLPPDLGSLPARRHRHESAAVDRQEAVTLFSGDPEPRCEEKNVCDFTPTVQKEKKKC